MRPSGFRFIVKLVQLISGHYRICRPFPIDSPVVYLVHHQNLRGPLLTRAWFDKPIRPWVLSVFLDRSTCFHQYYDYTLTKRTGVPKLLAYLPARFFSVLVSGMMPHLGAIPVFRGSRAIIKTFRLSLAALEQGDDLLICPDINYADTSPDIGDMHRGFLYLDRYYFKATGRRLPFVPLFVSKSRRCIMIGQPVTITAGETYQEEQSAAYDLIMQEFHRLEEIEASPQNGSPAKNNPLSAQNQAGTNAHPGK